MEHYIKEWIYKYTRKYEEMKNESFFLELSDAWTNDFRSFPFYKDGYEAIAEAHAKAMMGEYVDIMSYLLDLSLQA